MKLTSQEAHALLRAAAWRAAQHTNHAAAPVDPGTFHRAYQAFYGAAARATAKPTAHGTVRSQRGRAKTSHMIPQQPAVVACLAAAHDSLLEDEVAERTAYLVRLLALYQVLSDRQSLQEALTLHGISEEALVRSAAVAPIFESFGYRYFGTADLVRLGMQTAKSSWRKGS